MTNDDMRNAIISNYCDQTAEAEATIRNLQRDITRFQFVKQQLLAKVDKLEKAGKTNIEWDDLITPLT